VVPCDDGAAWHLHDLWARSAEFRPLIERSLGPAENYSTLEGRVPTMQAASELGICVPRTETVATADEVDASGLGWPAVLKIDGTWGGEGVAIVHDRQEARDAFGALLGAAGNARAWRRFLLNRHPLALWLSRRRKKSPILVQSFVAGRQATSMFACWKGEVLANVAVEVLLSRGPTGVADVVRVIDNREMESAARLLAKRFKLSGLHGLDFVIEDGTEAPYLIEMNARATQLGHLNVCAKGNLADALAARVTGTEMRPAHGARRISSDTIAHFPAAWKADPANPLLVTGFHDVPWEQPALVRELILDPWPERRLLSRILGGVWRRRPRGASSAGSRGGKDQWPLAG